MARVAGTKGFMLESRTCAVALAAIARELVVETSSMAAGRSKIFPSENMPEVELGWPPPRSSGFIKPGVPTAGPATDAAVPCTTPRVNSRSATCGAPQWPKRMFSSAHVLAPARTSTWRPRARPPAWTKSVCLAPKRSCLGSAWGSPARPPRSSADEILLDLLRGALQRGLRPGQRSSEWRQRGRARPTARRSSARPPRCSAEEVLLGQLHGAVRRGLQRGQ